MKCFSAGADGVQLTTDNVIEDIALQTAPEKRAIYNDTTVGSLGRVSLARVATVGQVQILAEGAIRAGHVEVVGLDIAESDTVARENVLGYGVVDVRQGALTLWNRQQDPAVVITALLKGITIGREGKPVRGSGVLLSGAGDNSGYFKQYVPNQPPVGRLDVSKLETGAIFSDGRIPEGTAKLISGGVFVAYGANVDLVRNQGKVTTYGPNDMVVDNWGDVKLWVAEAGLESRGPSAIGVVNFGGIKELKVTGGIETHGGGARGFNVYLGTVEVAEFDRIVTHGDASVGVQVSKHLGKLVVHDCIETFGGSGPSLVKGVIVQLQAMALSVQEGGEIGSIESGPIRTSGDGLSSLDVRGRIGRIAVRGGIFALGAGAMAVRVVNGTMDLDISPAPATALTPSLAGGEVSAGGKPAR